MAIVPPDDLWRKLEQLGEDQVRRRLAQGVYGPRKLPTVKAWLENKEREHQQAAAAAKHDATGRTANAAVGTRLATWVIAWATIALVLVGLLTLWLTR